MYGESPPFLSRSKKTDGDLPCNIIKLHIYRINFIIFTIIPANK
jgi:hypothetical protein